MLNLRMKNSESGFTLIEIIVSTAIFITVVSAMLAMFNYTLKINRRVQGLREVAQGTRTFTETLTREIRNGRVDYNSWTAECDEGNYIKNTNNTLGIISSSGDKLCFYFNSGALQLKKLTPTGEIIATAFGSTRFRIIPGSFHFYVYPKTDPSISAGGTYPGIQPYVTVTAQFELPSNEYNGSTELNYQTTISTDVYDIPHR
jgi:type II secretory pathway pseudopilin PulG